MTLTSVSLLLNNSTFISVNENMSNSSEPAEAFLCDLNDEHSWFGPGEGEQTERLSAEDGSCCNHQSVMCLKFRPEGQQAAVVWSLSCCDWGGEGHRDPRRDRKEGAEEKYHVRKDETEKEGGSGDL